jgi:hypothetical protein
MGKTVVMLPTLSKYAAKVQAKRRESMCEDVVVTTQTDIPSEHLGGPLYTSAPEGFFEGYVSGVDKQRGVAWIVSISDCRCSPVKFYRKNYKNSFKHLSVKQTVVYRLESATEGLIGVEVGMLEKI